MDHSNNKLHGTAGLNGLVSVVTAVHNEQRYVERVVESVARQTVGVLEHILVDDGSTDATPRLLQRLRKHHPHLVVISQAKAGAAVARNRGIAAARGRYIAFLDADDTWTPHKLEHQVRYMEAHQHSFTFGDYVEVDHHSLTTQKRYNMPDSVGHAQLLRGCPIGCLTVAYNQQKLGKRYMPLVRSGHDWGLWLDMTRGGLRAHKYPGLHASYSNGHASLSSKKIRKALNVYRIYRHGERLSRFAAMMRTAEHTVISFAKRARLIYASRREGQ